MPKNIILVLMYHRHKLLDLFLLPIQNPSADSVPYRRLVGIHGRWSAHRKVATYTGQHHEKNAVMQPCLEWDSNPQSHCLIGRRHLMSYTKRPLWSAVHWIQIEKTCTDVYRGIDVFFIWLKMPDVYFSQRAMHCTVMILAINFVLKAVPAWCSTSASDTRRNRTSWIASLHRSSV
jgi:hypothetical protein